MASIQDNVLNLTSLVEKLNKELDSHVDKLELGAQAVQKYNKEFAKTPSEYVKVLSTAKQRVDDLDKSTSKMVMTSKQMEAQSIKESNARNALNKQREVSIKQMEREQARLEASQSLYNKVQAKMNVLSNEYKNLATRKELGIKLTVDEEKNYTRLQGSIQRYDKVLKAVDATTGKFSRNVGNYAGNFNPLSNSINQLGREMPAFANSMQTGFMAISNNLPIFFDAMGNVIAQNKELQAQGLPTKSVLSQLASSLFSFQTLLSVGVTLLTVYGKEIVNWVSSLWGASDALNELNKNQKEFNNARFQGKKDAQSDIIELKKYLAVYNDTSLSVKDREIAYKKLSQQYAYYIKNVSDATIINGKYSEGVSKLLLDLEKQKGLEKETALQVTNKQKLIDLEKELSTLNKLETIKQKSLNNALKNNLSAQGLATISNELNKIQEKRSKVEKDINSYQEAINKNQIDIIKLTKERIGLEYTEDKQRDKKLKQLKGEKDLAFELVDVEASLFEVKKLFLEREIKMHNEIYNNDKKTLEDRLQSYDMYIKRKLDLEELEFNESNRLAIQSFEKEKENLQDTYNEYVKHDNITSEQRINAKKELNDAVTALTEKHNLDLGILELKHSNNVVEITKDTFEKIRKLQELYSGLEFNKSIKEKELNDLLEHKNRLENIDQDTTKKQLDNIAKTTKDANRKLQEEVLINDIANINKKLDNAQVGAEEELKLKTELYEKLKALNQLEIADLDEKRVKQEEYLKLLQDTYKGFIDSFASNSGFGKLIDLLNGGLEKFKGDAVATALVITEAFQEAFNTISEASQANFDAEYERLDRQTQNAIEFAGENEKAKEAIQEQADAKRREIQKREWKAKQEIAKTNILIDTAQAVVATLAQTPPPLGIPLAVAMGVWGAAQLAIVSNQKMPAFWKGTDNAPEGFAMVDELRPEVHTDKHGNIKSLGSSKGANVRYLEKGDKIYKSHTDFINKELSKNGIDPLGSFLNISMPKEIKGNDFSEVKQEISKLAEVIKNKESVSINIDEAGFRTNIGGATILNSRQKFIKRSI